MMKYFFDHDTLSWISKVQHKCWDINILQTPWKLTVLVLWNTEVSSISDKNRSICGQITLVHRKNFFSIIVIINHTSFKIFYNMPAYLSEVQSHFRQQLPLIKTNLFTTLLSIYAAPCWSCPPETYILPLIYKRIDCVK